MAFRPRHTRGQSAKQPMTISMRQMTSAMAGSVMILPRMAVKPHSSTQACNCHKARR